jgi:hypothetical protein
MEELNRQRGPATPKGRSSTAAGLALAAAAVVVGTVVGSWASFSFWETVPLVPCVIGAGVLAAAAAFRRRGRAIAVVVGLTVSAVTFVAALMMTLARWEG